MPQPTIMASDVWAVAVQGVQQSDREDFGHALADLAGRKRFDRAGLRGTCARCRRRACSGRPGHGVSGRVLADPGEFVHLRPDAGLLWNLVGGTCLRRAWRGA